MEKLVNLNKINLNKIKDFFKKKKSPKGAAKTEEEKREIEKQIREEKMEKELIAELDSEEVLKVVYEREIGKEPVKKGIETDDYKDWKYVKEHNKSLDPVTLTEVVDQYITESLLIKDVKERKVRVKELRLDRIAQEVASKFPYDKIIAADMVKGGNEVHGWLQINFADYLELLANYVLDRAAYYARIDYQPTPITIIREIDLDEYTKTGVELLMPYVLRHHPEQPFIKAIFYAKGALEEAINWQDGIPWLIDNFPTNVNLGKANLVLMDWALWNIPVFLVLHAPGKDYGVFDVRIDPEQKERELKAIQKQIIYDLRQREEPLLEKVDEMERGVLQWRESYTMLKDKAEVERGYNLEKNLEELEEGYVGRRKRKIKLWDIILIVILIVFFAILFWFLTVISSGDNPLAQNSTNIASVMFNLVKS